MRRLRPPALEDIHAALLLIVNLLADFDAHIRQRARQTNKTVRSWWRCRISNEWRFIASTGLRALWVEIKPAL